jgi:hypothetical protein
MQHGRNDIKNFFSHGFSNNFVYKFTAVICVREKSLCRQTKLTQKMICKQTLRKKSKSDTYNSILF